MATPMKSGLRHLVFLSALPFAACGGELPMPKPAGSGTAATVSAAEVKAQFESVCFTCHGNTGHGDGPGAAQLNPKPRSFADATWQSSVTDEHIKKTIVFGGAAVGKNAVMPAHPQYKGKEALLDGLVQIVRGFKGK
jgi:hypothetical protein